MCDSEGRRLFASGPGLAEKDPAFRPCGQNQDRLGV